MKLYYSLPSVSTSLELDLEEITGAKGVGFHRLSLRASLSYPTTDGVDRTINEVSLEATAGNLPLGRFSHQASGAFPHQLNAFGNSVGWSYILDLSPAQFEALERIRGGRNLDLHLTAMVSASGLPNYAPGNIYRTSQQGVYSVPKSAWVEKVIGQLDHLHYVTLEVPSADSQADPLLGAAAAKLEEGRRLLAQGYDQQAVAKCRDALEKVTEAVGLTLGDEAKLAKFAASSIENSKKLDKAGRLAVVRHSVRNLTSLAHHGGSEPITTDWGPHGGMAAIASVAAMIEATYAPGARDRAASELLIAEA